MRFWVVTALRYIKSEEITPVELMTANELGSQLTPSATKSQSMTEEAWLQSDYLESSSMLVSATL